MGRAVFAIQEAAVMSMIAWAVRAALPLAEDDFNYCPVWLLLRLRVLPVTQLLAMECAARG